MKVKIYGAGSIGNHLAQAARRMGWSVLVVDTDVKALKRMKEDIYPTRYGAWDESIALCESKDEPKGEFDIIMIGTPPHIRMKLAIQALDEKPKILFLEKPLSFPFDPDLKKFLTKYNKQKNTVAVVGYDHSVSKSIERVVELLKKKIIGNPLTLDVEFREHWKGIFKAHPWLSGPADSYLGYWKRGGGASGEHSHALHLWYCLAKASNIGVPKNTQSLFKVEKKGKAEYDSLAAFQFETEKGKTGRVIQDVITQPTRKWARVQGDVGFIEWICNGHPSGDLVRYSGKDEKIQEEIFEKKRPDDFFKEMFHLQDIIDKKVKLSASPLSLENGVAVMHILENAWKKKQK